MVDETEKKALEAAEAAETERVQRLKPDRELALDWLAMLIPQIPAMNPELESILNQAKFSMEEDLGLAAKAVTAFCNPHNTIGG
jgi:hypothetical protein